MERNIKIWMIVLIFLALSFIATNKIMGDKARTAYEQYYNSACEVQKKEAEVGYSKDNLQKAEICKKSGGCYIKCGSACPPKQKISFAEILLEKSHQDTCITLCVPQCVCEFGKIFDERKGCIKKEAE